MNNRQIYIYIWYRKYSNLKKKEKKKKLKIHNYLGSCYSIGRYLVKINSVEWLKFLLKCIFHLHSCIVIGIKLFPLFCWFLFLLYHIQINVEIIYTPIYHVYCLHHVKLGSNLLVKWNRGKHIHSLKSTCCRNTRQK